MPSLDRPVLTQTIFLAMNVASFCGFWAQIICPIVQYFFAETFSVIGCWIKKTEDDAEHDSESDRILEMDQSSEFLQYIGRFNDFLLVTFLFGILHFVSSNIYNMTVQAQLNEARRLYSKSADIYTKQFIVVRLLRYPGALHKLAIHCLMEFAINVLAFIALFWWMHNGIFFYFVHDLAVVMLFQACSGRLCVLFEKATFCGVSYIDCCTCIEVSNNRLAPMITAVWLVLMYRIIRGFGAIMFFYNAFFTDNFKTISNALVIAQVMDDFDDKEKHDKMVKDIMAWKVSEDSYDNFKEAIPFIFKEK